MKAQTYYCCQNCGKIGSVEVGKPQSSCMDCGSPALKLLVPVDSLEKVDPITRRQKTIFGIVVGLAGVGTIIVFLIFGSLLRGYLRGEETRDVTEKLHQALTEDIKRQETVLAELRKTAEEDRAVAGMFSSDAAKVSSARAELDVIEGERARIREAAGIVAARKEALDLEIREKEKEKAELLATLAELKRQGIETTSKVSEARALLDSLNAARDEAREDADAQSARAAATISALATRKDALDSEIREKETAHADLVATLAELKQQMSDALVKVSETRAVLVSLNAARDQAREEADAQSARAAATISTLTVRKAALESEIREQEGVQAALEATLVELKKQVSSAGIEASKARAALDSLNAMRDQAQEEADLQSARAAKFRVEATAAQGSEQSEKKP